MKTKCTACEKFFSRFACNFYFGECDCPECQGYCECRQKEKKEMSEFISLSANLPKDPFLRGYLVAAEFSGPTEEMQDRMAGVETVQWAEESLRQAERDCADFQREAEVEGARWMNPEAAGGDFWYTRNRHGVGFWDGDYPEEIGDKLTKLSRKFPEVSVEFDEAKGELELVVC